MGGWFWCFGVLVFVCWGVNTCEGRTMRLQWGVVCALPTHPAATPLCLCLGLACPALPTHPAATPLCLCLGLACPALPTHPAATPLCLCLGLACPALPTHPAATPLCLCLGLPCPSYSPCRHTIVTELLITLMQVWGVEAVWGYVLLVRVGVWSWCEGVGALGVGGR